MKKNLFAFSLYLIVLLWAVWVVVGYVADRVTSYAGPTPMALDTAVCFLLLSVGGLSVSTRRMPDGD